MISVFIFAAVLVLASSEVVQYHKDIQCSLEGPEFWCRNEATAKQCLATSYCSEHVWSKKEPKADYCTTCQQYVGTVYMLLGNNETQAEIMSAMKSMCAMLPTTYQSMCTEYVSQYGQEVIDLLMQYTADPAKFCTLIGLCSNATNQQEPPHVRILKNLMIQQGSTDYCLTCEQYVGTLHLFISNNATQEQLINELKSACTLLPTSISSECTALMTIYAPQIVKWLVDYTADPSKFCTTIGLCKGQISTELVRSQPVKDVLKISMEPALIKKTAPVMKPIAPSSGTTCEICTVAMGYLEGILKENKTAAAIKNALDNLCAYLPSELGDECKLLVSEYSDQIIILLVDELKDPTEVCKDLGLCTSSKKVVSLKKTVSANPITCEICEYAMGYLASMLEGNTTEEAVKEALDKLCSELPSRFSSECKSLVDQYADQIIQLLVNELADPAALCKDLGLCTSSMKAVKKTMPNNAVTCELCEVAMGYLEKMLEGNTTEAAITHALENLCSYLPSAYQGECKSLVDQYADEIIRLLVNELASPATLCKELGLCTSSMKDVSVKKTMPNNAVTCELCELAMGYLENILKGNTTEAAIIHALENLCSYLPSTYQSECKSLVDQYADEIIRLLVDELASPATLCKELNLCTSSLKITKNIIRPASTVRCEMCTWAMGKLDAMLTDKSTEEEIKQAVESLCADLPASMSGECKSLVDQYGDAIISMLAQEMDPTTICQALGLCSGEKKQLGNRKYALAMRMSLKGVSCEVCEYAMGYLDNLLESKQGEAEVEAAVEKLCSYLPDAFKNECDALITEYGDDLIKLIVQQIKPAVVCKELKLC